jgi:hypothetical protein
MVRCAIRLSVFSRRSRDVRSTIAFVCATDAAVWAVKAAKRPLVSWYEELAALLPVLAVLKAKTPAIVVAIAALMRAMIPAMIIGSFIGSPL